MGIKSRASRAAREAEHRRLVATTVEPEGACAKAARLAKEDRQRARGVSDYLGASSTAKPYNHGKDCRRWMMGAEYERDWRGSNAVIVREAYGDDPRMLVHLCGKAGPKCRIAAVFNRIPDSAVSKSDTTEMVARCAAHPRGFVQAALRDIQTSYRMGKARVEGAQ